MVFLPGVTATLAWDLLYHWSRNRTIKMASMKAAWYQRFDMMSLKSDMRFEFSSLTLEEIFNTENLTARNTDLDFNVCDLKREKTEVKCSL